MSANSSPPPGDALDSQFVTVVDGRSHATLRGAGNPIAELHARTWAVGTSPTEAEVRAAYVAAGFSKIQLDRAYRRKERWHSLPEVAVVRFSKPIGTALQQSELLLNVAAV
jgi:hypothetical protein